MYLCIASYIHLKLVVGHDDYDDYQEDLATNVYFERARL